MMYDNKLAVAIKSNGKVLREFNKDTVYLKFGSEYSFLIKNLNTRRAVVKIEIDGDEVTKGGLIVDANREIELERFIRDLNEGNRFKFIEKTAAIEAHRGNKLQDGLVRIEFEFEREQLYWGSNRLGGSYDPWSEKIGGYNPTYYGDNTLRSVKGTSAVAEYVHDTD